MDEWAYLKGATYSVTFELVPHKTTGEHCEIECYQWKNCANNCGDVTDYKLKN